MNKTFIFLFIVIMAAGAGLTFAGSDGTVHSIKLPEVKTVLKAGEGRDTTERYCSICHSLDYITMQPKFSKAKWTAIVNKMIKVMGAPIPQGDAKVIAGYLGAEYGTGD
jgi:cytochrome c5